MRRDPCEAVRIDMPDVVQLQPQQGHRSHPSLSAAKVAPGQSCTGGEHSRSVSVHSSRKAIDSAQSGCHAHHWSEELVSQRWMNSTCSHERGKIVGGTGSPGEWALITEVSACMRCLHARCMQGCGHSPRRCVAWRAACASVCAGHACLLVQQLPRLGGLAGRQLGLDKLGLRRAQDGAVGVLQICS